MYKSMYLLLLAKKKAYGISGFGRLLGYITLNNCLICFMMSLYFMQACAHSVRKSLQDPLKAELQANCSTNL